MFLELIATLFAGVAAAGVVLLLNKVLKGRLPKWFMPVAAGAAMLVATISSEYGWYPRTKNTLPEGMEIVQSVDSKALYRPWTYLRPFTERFVAVDTVSINTHDAQPDMRLADVYFFGRWSPVNKLAVLTDCANGRRAALIDAVTFHDDGTVTGADWVEPESGDPILTSICGG
ncbi:hypothetical protein SAMN05444000_1395 [Shimia gijangensis]|uniref:Uncharacterized protein n=1 Tax=Shimia gijangensis TaxID=1470563 RepID=A0A1M6TFF7_9RHOB|nr:hypothetical protein [Shimia gijangensis]SHK55700.1 hypothetical protein SAMN05444000_1395 [Shimia gijangensis]